jgi:heme/copper-type cytochrome/quinol oxidase subunit 2
MPIMVKVVSKEDFAKWVVKAKVEYASDDQPEAGVKVATITKKLGLKSAHHHSG